MLKGSPFGTSQLPLLHETPDYIQLEMGLLSLSFFIQTENLGKVPGPGDNWDFFSCSTCHQDLTLNKRDL